MYRDKKPDPEACLRERSFSMDRGYCDPGAGSNTCSIRQVIFTVNDIQGYLQRLRILSTDYGSHIIIFNKEMMAGIAHVEMALTHAFRAAVSGTCISGSVEIEALLYAAGSRQVIDGVKFGLHEGINRAYLCICPEHETIWSILSREVTLSSDNWEIFDNVKKSRLISLFNVTPEELAVTGEDRLTELILERVALLDVYK